MGKNIVEIQTYQIILSGIFEKETLICILKNASLKTFEIKAMQYVVTYLWNHLYRRYLFRTSLYQFLIFAFSLGHWFSPFEGVWGEFSIPMLVVSSVVDSSFILMECRHIKRRGIINYFQSGWNCYEMIVYLLVIVSLLMHLAGAPSRVLDAYTIILLEVKATPPL